MENISTMNSWKIFFKMYFIFNTDYVVKNIGLNLLRASFFQLESENNNYFLLTKEK